MLELNLAIRPISRKATITCTSKATGLKGTCTVTVLQTMGSLTKDGDEIEMVTDINEMEEPAVIEPFDVYDTPSYFCIFRKIYVSLHYKL